MDTSKYTALQIARYFIKKSESEPDRAKLTNLKLQKILYYAQGWYLANFKKPLFNDRIEAWKYGPAIRVVYQEFKNNGNAVIQENIEDWEIKEIDKITKAFLDEVWNVYGKYSGSDLVSLTHSEIPYKEARDTIKEGDYSDIEISTLSMQNFFSEKLHGKV
ncbi:MAG TPA: type II toxin-antitoxin system antitoxin SocA domain-containing protein [Patescibacteria group bacterium]|nr:type II toxin-antitoxin system antitoxin SocA domain-containing protein [Patescibacteria group bacterium]